MKSGLFFNLAALFLLASLFPFFINTTVPSDFEQSTQELMLRNIGHELLLRSGNTTSRVLPIEPIGKNDYYIRFEPELSIFPDSLVQIVNRNLAQQGYQSDYLAEVLDCDESKVQYGFAMLPTKRNDVVPCLSRPLPEGCYYLHLKFHALVKLDQANVSPSFLLLSSGLVLLLLGVWKTKDLDAIEVNMPDVVTQHLNGKALGDVMCYFDEQFLILNDEKIELTEKENRLLQLLGEQANQVVPRAELQEKIWGDEGVMVSRSLDMFISRLRKKIKPAQQLKIVTLRGKGWRLEVK